MLADTYTLNEINKFFFVVLLFEIGFLYVTLTVLELALVEQAGLELRDLLASASRVLVLKVCATTARQNKKNLKLGESTSSC